MTEGTAAQISSSISLRTSAENTNRTETTVPVPFMQRSQ